MLAPLALAVSNAKPSEDVSSILTSEVLYQLSYVGDGLRV
jgi:hypothetical protein